MQQSHQHALFRVQRLPTSLIEQRSSAARASEVGEADLGPSAQEMKRIVDGMAPQHGHVQEEEEEQGRWHAVLWVCLFACLHVASTCCIKLSRPGRPFFTLPKYPRGEITRGMLWGPMHQSRGVSLGPRAQQKQQAFRQ